MRHLYSYIKALLLLLPLFYSCNNDIDPLSPPTSEEGVVVSFYISGGSPSEEATTRATNYISVYESHIDIQQLKIKLIANNQTIDFTRLNIYPSVDNPGVYQVIGELDIPSQYINTPTTYRLEVFSNCGTNPIYNSSLTYSFDWSLYNGNAGSNIKYIPMWGVVTQNLTLQPGIRAQLNTIHLLRAISKIEIQLSDALSHEYQIGDIVLNQYNQQGYSLPYNSDQIQQTNASPTQPNVPSGNTTLNNMPLFLYQGKAYAYLPEAVSTSSLNYNITLNNTLYNTTKNYNMTFNPKSVNSFQNVIRNKVYKYTVTRIKETEQLDCNYTVKDWLNKDIQVDTDDLHWLWVKDDTLYMNNVNQIKTIFDSSTEDLVCTVSNQKIYSTNTPWPASQGNATAVATAAHNGNITIDSPVPTNFVGKEFTVTIHSNISGKTAIIKVYQFPPLYVSFVKTGTPLTNTSGQVNDSLYIFTALLPDLTSIPYPDDQNFARSTWSNGVTYTNTLHNNSSFGYPQTTSTAYSNTNGNFTSTNSGAIAAKNYPNSTHVLTTVETVENNLLVSPHFMLASQAGINSPATYSERVDWCRRYREYIVQNSATDYGPGNWRLATRSEVYLIDILQNIKVSAVKRILEGSHYWSAYAPTGTTPYTIPFIDWRLTVNEFTSTSGSARCVRDIK